MWSKSETRIIHSSQLSVAWEKALISLRAFFMSQNSEQNRFSDAAIHISDISTVETQYTAIYVTNAAVNSIPFPSEAPLSAIA